MPSQFIWKINLQIHVCHVCTCIWMNVEHFTCTEYKENWKNVYHQIKAHIVHTCNTCTAYHHLWYMYLGLILLDTYNVQTVCQGWIKDFMKGRQNYKNQYMPDLLFVIHVLWFYFTHGLLVFVVSNHEKLSLYGWN